MIISRSPFRISFAGGGSDLPDFFRHHEGAVVSTTIDKYLYITVHRNFDQKKILLKYSKTEQVTDPRKIENTIARSIISEYDLRGIGIETVGDVPSKTGLGSSGAFSVGLHNVLNAYMGRKVSRENLARKACATEITKLGSPVGKQDQYASAYGGFNLFRFLPNNQVRIEPIRMSLKKKLELNRNLLMFYTGITRSANEVLSRQRDNLNCNSDTIKATEKMVNIAYAMRDILERGKLRDFAGLLHENWILKRSLSESITSDLIDGYYAKALRSGALGGKLLGAGGGGFLLFYCEEKFQDVLRKSLGKLREVPFRFTTEGSEIIFRDQ